jgi:hypothetical protein
MTQKPGHRDHCNRGFPPCTSPPSRQRDDPTTPIVAESWHKDRSPVLANNNADTTASPDLPIVNASRHLDNLYSSVVDSLMAH